MNPVLSFINNANLRGVASNAVPSTYTYQSATVSQSYGDPSVQDLARTYKPNQPTYRLEFGPDDTKVPQPAKVVDGKHAVLIIREAPDTSTQVTSDAIKQAKDMVPRSPIGKIKFITDDFLLDSVSETEEERMVSSYNLRGAVISSTAENGKKPRIFAYAGKLLANNIDGSSFAHMVDAWDKYLRATACVIDITGTYKTVATPLVAELHYRDQVRRGYLMNVSYSLNSFTESLVTFSFSMFVTEMYAKEPATPKTARRGQATGGTTAPFPYKVRERNGLIERYNPVTGRWDPVTASEPTGGTTASFPYNSRQRNGVTERYNPTTGTWEPIGSTDTEGGATAPFPNKSRVRNGVSEVYDSSTGTWVPSGGATEQSNYAVRQRGSDVERYNPNTGQWDKVASDVAPPAPTEARPAPPTSGSADYSSEPEAADDYPGSQRDEVLDNYVRELKRDQLRRPTHERSVWRPDGFGGWEVMRPGTGSWEPFP